MKPKSIKLTIVMLFIVLITVLGACTTSESVVSNQSQSKMPNIKGSKEISLNSSDLEAIKVDFFGYESTLFQNSLVVKVSSKTEDEIFPDLEKTCQKAGDLIQITCIPSGEMVTCILLLFH